MTDINTPEGRKALRDAYERWADYGGDFPDVDDLAISVPALLDALEGAERENSELRRVNHGHEVTDAINQSLASSARVSNKPVEALRSRAATAERLFKNCRKSFDDLKAENARIRERLGRIEKAAGAVLNHGGTGREGDALRAALEPTK